MFPSADDELASKAAASSNMLTVHNVLASASLVCSQRLDLDRCCQVLGNSYYNPAEFPALRIDVRGRSNAIYTLSLFESGRIQSAGGCRPHEAKRAMMKIGKRLNKSFNYGVELQSFQIQNILAVFDSCYPINLGHFASTFDHTVDYEPDRFPAARVRIAIPSSKSAAPASPEKDEESTEKRVSVKLRKLMIGDAAGEEEFQTETSGRVGSYIIGAGAKRTATTRAREEKQAKEEVVTANVFSTGKITFTGAKSIGSLNFALEKLKPAIGIRSVGSLVPPPSYGFQPFMPHPLQHQAPAPPGSLAARTQQLALQEHQQQLRSFRASHPQAFQASQNKAFQSYAPMYQPPIL